MISLTRNNHVSCVGCKAFLLVNATCSIFLRFLCHLLHLTKLIPRVKEIDNHLYYFVQRYGWHGFDALLQKSFDVAAVKYPWLNDYREKAVTELEFLHGHLRNPGKRAACFFFRDKVFDTI